jgi:hypothetical protein
MDIIKIFLRNPRRYIPDFSKNTKKVQKRKITIITKFLWFAKKKQNVKNLKDLKHRHIEMYIEEIEKKGVWDKSRKQYRKISERTLRDHISILRNFVDKVKIEK